VEEVAAKRAPVKAIVLMGVSGCGKTTVGRLLARSLQWPFYDGDDFQPQSNLVKMSQGFSLTDEDRAPWLKALGDLLAGILERRGHAVLACSLLKAAYRERVLGGRNDVGLVHLKGPYGLIEARLKAREGHFFKSGMLAGQIEILEEPEAPVVEIDREPGAVADAVRAIWGL
jgi:gluconokinase